MGAYKYQLPKKTNLTPLYMSFFVLVVLVAIWIYLDTSTQEDLVQVADDLAGNTIPPMTALADIPANQAVSFPYVTTLLSHPGGEEGVAIYPPNWIMRRTGEDVCGADGVCWTPVQTEFFTGWAKAN